MRTEEAAPPVAREDIDSFERNHDMVLPLSYRAFLLEHNGGRPERDLFDVPNFPPSQPDRIHFFFGLKDPMNSNDLEWNLEVLSDRIPPEMLAIASTGTGDVICMYVSGERYGQIFFWDGHDFWDGKWTTGERFYKVADSFEEFIAGLYRDEHSPNLTN